MRLLDFLKSKGSNGPSKSGITTVDTAKNSKETRNDFSFEIDEQAADEDLSVEDVLVEDETVHLDEAIDLADDEVTEDGNDAEDGDADVASEGKEVDLSTKTPLQIIRHAVIACADQADEEHRIDLALIDHLLTEVYGVDYAQWGFSTLEDTIREFGPMASKLCEHDGKMYFLFERRNTKFTAALSENVLTRLDKIILNLCSLSPTGWADNAKVAAYIKNYLPEDAKLSRIYPNYPDRYEVVKDFIIEDKTYPLLVRLKGNRVKAEMPTTRGEQQQPAKLTDEFLNKLDSVIAELTAESAIDWADNAKVAFRLREEVPNGVKLSALYPEMPDRYEMVKDLIINDKKYPLLVRLKGEAALRQQDVAQKATKALRGPIPTLKAHIFIKDVQEALVRIAEMAGGHGAEWEVMTAIDEKMQLQQLFYFTNLSITRTLYAHQQGCAKPGEYFVSNGQLFIATGCIAQEGTPIYLQCNANNDMTRGIPQPWILEDIVTR